MLRKIFLMALLTVIFVVVTIIAVLHPEKFFLSPVGNFRSLDSLKKEVGVNIQGLDNLNISGSKICRLDLLKEKLSFVKAPVYIVDSLGDEHGFVYGYPDVFLGYGRGASSSLGLCDKVKFSIRRLCITGTIARRFDLRTSEAVEAAKYGFHYIALPFPKSNQLALGYLKTLYETVSKIPGNSWIHVHCANGKGRTTVAMVAIDIIKNAPDVSLEDIIQRHKQMGSEDLNDISVRQDGTYTEAELKQRKQLIKDFYEYIASLKKQDITDVSYQGSKY